MSVFQCNDVPTCHLFSLLQVLLLPVWFSVFLSSTRQFSFELIFVASCTRMRLCNSRSRPSGETRILSPMKPAILLSIYLPMPLCLLCKSNSVGSRKAQKEKQPRGRRDGSTDYLRRSQLTLLAQVYWLLYNTGHSIHEIESGRWLLPLSLSFSFSSLDMIMQAFQIIVWLGVTVTTCTNGKW